MSPQYISHTYINKYYIYSMTMIQYDIEPYTPTAYRWNTAPMA